MDRFHIDIHGVPVPCDAKIKCRAKGGPTDDNGDTIHFEGSKEDAQRWAEEENAKAAGGSFGSPAPAEEKNPFDGMSGNTISEDMRILSRSLEERKRETRSKVRQKVKEYHDLIDGGGYDGEVSDDDIEYFARESADFAANLSHRSDSKLSHQEVDFLAKGAVASYHKRLRLGQEKKEALKDTANDTILSARRTVRNNLEFRLPPNLR